MNWVDYIIEEKGINFKGFKKKNKFWYLLKINVYECGIKSMLKL